VEPGPWNWLEIAKLTAGLLTPVALAFFGVYIHRVTKRFEQMQWRSQKLVEKRLAIYDDLAPQLNDLLCYFTYVGCWRDLDPPAVVSLKRVIDKNVHVAAPLFTEEFFDSCMALQQLCFKTYTGWGRDASLRTNFQRRLESRATDWNSDWDKYFDAEVDSHCISTCYSGIRAGYRSSFLICSPAIRRRSL
jgi:hypothetical protein